MTIALLVHALALDVENDAMIYDADMKSASRSYLTNPDLLWPEQSPFHQMITAANDMAYIQLMRVDFQTFNAIIQHVDVLWSSHIDGFADIEQQHARVGRPRRLNARAVIGMTLVWLATPAQQKFIQLCFGAGPAVVSRGIKMGFEQLLAALRRMPDTDVTWPTAASMARYNAAIVAKYGPPPVADFFPWGFVDGVRQAINNCNSAFWQEMYYNGHLKLCNFNNVLVWVPDGRCVWASLCHEGNKGDYRCSLTLFNALRDAAQTPPGFGLLGDHAFSSLATNDIIGTEAFRDGTPGQLSAAEKVAWEAWWGPPRKSAEFGMRVLTSLWRRLQLNLPSMPDNRRFNMELMEMALRLTNLIAVNMVHHNQLRTMYGLAQMNDLEGNADIAQNEWPLG